MVKRYCPSALRSVGFSALITAIRCADTRTVASYGARMPGLSWQGIQLRARIGWDWVNRNGWPDDVCSGPSHWRAVALSVVA